MNIIPTNIPDVLIIEPTVFGDERGFFFENYNKKVFDKAIGRDVNFVQDNHSRSTRGVLRGMHYQIQKPQAKLLRVSVGEAFDVAVDMRRSSSTFGQWAGVVLSADNKRQLWIPEGFAHGFVVLSDIAECQYKVNNDYAPEFERALAWNDKQVGIVWPFDGVPILSPKDAAALAFDVAETYE